MQNQAGTSGNDAMGERRFAACAGMETHATLMQRFRFNAALLRRPEAVLVWGTLLLVAVLYFTPSSIFKTLDYVLFFDPHIQFLRDAVFELRAPLWNPYIGLGRPFLADVQPAVFYPPTYLVVFSGGVGLFVFLWLHMLLAARGMFALGR